MRVVVFRAALYCEDCGADIAARLAHVPEAERDDTDRFPLVCEEGESDTPSHCEGCGVFLRSDLTDDGREYVAERIRENPRHGIAGRVWRPYYETIYGKGFWK
jgi:hypothetical protein